MARNSNAQLHIRGSGLLKRNVPPHRVRKPHNRRVRCPLKAVVHNIFVCRFRMGLEVETASLNVRRAAVRVVSAGHDLSDIL